MSGRAAKLRNEISTALERNSQLGLYQYQRLALTANQSAAARGCRDPGAPAATLAMSAAAARAPATNTQSLLLVTDKHHG